MKRAVQYLALFFAAFSIAGVSGYVGVVLFTRSAPEVTVPDLRGKNIIDVLEILTRMGLNPKLYRTGFHDSIPKYGVTFQDPEPGTVIKKGRDVALHISKGIKIVELPDVRQIPLGEALLRLEASQIQPGKILRVHSEKSLKGAVISQYPLPFDKTPAGSACDLLVSKGPARVFRVMPDLGGERLGTAVQKIEQQGLSISLIRSEDKDFRPRGIVLVQHPAPGSRVEQNAPVELVINRKGQPGKLSPERLKSCVWISFQVPLGFSRRHVQVETDFFGTFTDYINDYMKPGKMINLLIPGGIKTKIRIFIDHQLVEMTQVDPWDKGSIPVSKIPFQGTGEFTWQ